MTQATQFESSLHEAADAAARRIPPVWPLASSVAVNPFLGHTSETLADTAASLARIAAIPVTMPRAWYLDRIESGAITDDDLEAALSASPHAEKPADLPALKAAAREERALAAALATIAEIASEAADTDWPGILADRFGVWAGGYLDEGQALWAAPQAQGAWATWCAYATHDLTPEIMGLEGFGAFVADAPRDPLAAIARAVDRLGVAPEARATYFHRLLMSLGGWSQFARYRLWRAELTDAQDSTLIEFLAIRLVWEEALYERFESQIAQAWAETRAEYGRPAVPGREQIVDAILQEAAERSAQRDLAATLAARTSSAIPQERPTLQAAFCIDVRSEVFRRALEAVDPTIRTMGFAGFFGVFARHHGCASDLEELRLPVLLNPTVNSRSGEAESAQAPSPARLSARARRAWGRFKLAAVSSFAFVEAMGPVYIGKLLRDGLGLAENLPPNEPAPQFEPALDTETRIGAAETVLRAMSLTSGFGRVVLLAGHGANVVNNPHASGLHCGACGGYSGEVNARLLAQLLNEPGVRAGLAGRGIDVPEDTLFVAALHDTTTDIVTLYDQDVDTVRHRDDLGRIRGWLAAAGRATRAERALRLPRADGEGDIAARARDWAEVRPEWALAGCKAFIAAPRSRTSGRSLEGRAFLHDYAWQEDARNGFGVLELIMTAPVVVASWISLQYYGSTVAPDVFGSGNKLLHNVVGGIGVFEGNGGLLRAGLPWQSVHDGEDFVHEPLRLSVCIEAPVDAMNDVLRRHAGVRELFDNRWLHLFAIDEDGRLGHRYTRDLQWEPLARSAEAADRDRQRAVA